MGKYPLRQYPYTTTKKIIMSKTLATAVWHILENTPIKDQALKEATVKAIRQHPDYLKEISTVSKNKKQEEKNYQEELSLTENKGGKIKPKYIVLHHSSGSYAGTKSWIMNPASKVSYHYLINPENGNLTQFVYDTRKAWHAGRSKWKSYRNLNNHSIGISFSGDTHSRKVNSVEIDSCAKKCLYLMDKFGLVEKHIITHKMIAPKRKNDCSEATYNRVIERIKELKNKQ